MNFFLFNIIAFILLSTCETNLSLQKHYFENSNGKNMQKWVSKVVSKFYNDQTVDKCRIVVLMWQVFGIYGKTERKLCARDISSTTDIISTIPTVGMCENKFRTTHLNLTMIQRLKSPRSLFYWDRFEYMREKNGV